MRGDSAKKPSKLFDGTPRTQYWSFISAAIRPDNVYTTFSSHLLPILSGSVKRAEEKTNQDILSTLQLS